MVLTKSMMEKPVLRGQAKKKPVAIKRSRDFDFWMLFVEGGSNPIKKHVSLQEAKEEAMRLARTTKKAVYLLHCVDKCEVKIVEPEVVWG